VPLINVSINVTSDTRDGYYAAIQRHDLSCTVDIRLLTFTVPSKAWQMGDANHAMSSTCFVLDVKRFLLDERLYLFIFADSRSPRVFLIERTAVRAGKVRRIGFHGFIHRLPSA